MQKKLITRVNFVSTPEDREKWKIEAHRQRKSLGEFMRDAADAACKQEYIIVPANTTLIGKPFKVDSRKAPRPTVKRKDCTNRLMPGSFCHMCGETH